MDLVAVFHRTGSVLDEKHTENGVLMDVRLKKEELMRLAGKDEDIRIIE